MVKLQKLKLEGFFGIVDVEIDLDSQGLVLVTGVNGSGKTALVVEGLFYALYGQSFEYEKVPGEKVVNWRIGHMLVEVNLAVDGCFWMIRRSRNHPEHETGLSLFQWDIKKNKWADRTLGTSSATQQKITLLLGITAEGFSSSVVFSTDLLRFPDYPDAMKKKIIADLLHLNEADVALARIKDARQIKLREKEIVDRDWGLAYATLEKHQESLAALQAVTEFDGEERIAELEKEIGDIHRDAEAITETLNTLTAEAQARIVEHKAKLQEFDETFLDRTQQIADLNAEQTTATQSLEIELAELNGQADRARRKVASTAAELAKTSCPTCKREWDEEHKNTLAAERDRVQAMIPEIADAIVAVQADIDAAALPFADRRADLSGEIRVLNQERAKLRAEIAKDESAIAKNQASIVRGAGLTRNQLAEVERQLATLRAARARTEGILAEREDRIETVLAEIAEQEARCFAFEGDASVLATELDDLQVLLECFGPKGARVLLLQSAVPALNRFAYEAAEIIAPGISIQFLVDEETKGRVDIAVDNANGARQYHGNSGGERRKVDLVVLFALMRLSTVRMNVLVVDEAFEKLSEDAQQLIAAYLRQLSREIPSIFMVNHTALSLSSSADQIWHMNQGRLVSMADNRK